MSEEDRQRLYKQAARKRKAAVADKRTKKRVDYTREYHQDKLTEDSGFEKRKGPRPVSLEDWMLKLLAEEDFDKKAAATDAAKETHTGIVLAVRSSKCRLAYDGQEIKCLLRPELTMGQRSDLAVGDDVKFSHSDDGTMIVVDNARKFIGKNVNVTVTSVLQTSAGRMIFANLNEKSEPRSQSGGNSRRVH